MQAISYVMFSVGPATAIAAAVAVVLLLPPGPAQVRHLLPARAAVEALMHQPGNFN